MSEKVPEHIRFNGGKEVPPASRVTASMRDVTLAPLLIEKSNISLEASILSSLASFEKWIEG